MFVAVSLLLAACLLPAAAKLLGHPKMAVRRALRDPLAISLGG